MCPRKENLRLVAIKRYPRIPKRYPRFLIAIYIFICQINNKKYVGQTIDDVFNHFQIYSRGKDPSMMICRAIKKYKPENFKIRTLGFVSTCEQADFMEAYYIKLHKTMDRRYGYNLKPGGSAARGWKNPHTKGWNENISKALTKIKRTSEQIAALSERMRRRMLGSRRSLEAIEKTAKANRGRKRTPKQRARISKAMLGGKLSARHRANISKAQTGRKFSAEHRANMSKAHIGHKDSAKARLNKSKGMIKYYKDPKAREKTRLALIGTKATPEARANLRKGAAVRWARPEEHTKMSRAKKARRKN